MSDSTPAALKASPRNLRSAVSQRADDAASGRITPTLALASGVDVSLLPFPLLDDDPESSSPHATTLNASAAATANAPRARYVIDLPFLRFVADGDYLRIRSIHSQMSPCQALVARAPRPNTSATAPNTSA